MKMRPFYFIFLLSSISVRAQIVITNVNILDAVNNKLVSHQSVLIEGNIIKTVAPAGQLKIPANARIIKGDQKFLMAGLIDSHAHPWDGDMYSDDGIDLTKYKSFQLAIDESKARLSGNYKRFLQCGITTIISPGTTVSTFKLSESLAAQNSMPSLFMAGKLITVSDFGNPHNLSPDDVYYDYAPNAETARQIVQSQVSLNVSFIKILFVPDLGWAHIADSARAKFPIVKAIIDEAHKNGIKVAVHATERITAQLAVEAGCDYLAHGIHDEIVGADFIDLLKTRNVMLCPTSNVEFPILRAYTQRPSFTPTELKYANPFVVKTFFDLEDLDSSLYRSTKTRWEAGKSIFKRDSIRLVNLKKLTDGGVRIAAGTDVGSLGNMPAASYLPELRKMKESGMSNWDIIRAGTINPTYFIGKPDSLGTIEAGKIADMVLLNNDPVADLENLNDITLVFKNGHAISPDTLVEETPEMIAQRVWNAYNAKNIEAFLACFAADVKVYDSAGKLLYKGVGEIAKHYTAQLANDSTNHCEVKNRKASGAGVVDDIVMTDAGKPIEKHTILFKIANAKVISISVKN